jgi:hypothetical protein
MTTWLRWFLPLLLAGVLIGCGVMTSSHSSRKTGDGIALGEPAPEIEGEDIDGRPMKLSDYRGRVVMLDFWGDW